MDPIIRWAGSKRQLLTKLKEFWDGKGRRYVEPFCGSACLFFDLEPTSAVLGDLNHELISAYEALRRDPGAVYAYLRELPRTKAAYYRIRSMDPSDLTLAQKAARFFYLNRYCFNGIYRTNLRGQFNVPRGSKITKAGFDYEQMEAAADLLRRCLLVNADFEVTLNCVGDGDFVYLDPPYAVSNRRIFTEYHPESFGVDDLLRLKHWLAEIDRRGASFVISYADSAEARRLLQEWGPRRVWTRRHIAGFAADRRGAFEILATNIQSHAE